MFESQGSGEVRCIYVPIELDVWHAILYNECAT